MNKSGNFDYIIYADGGARGNPGNAAYGFVIKNKNNETLYQEGKRIGVTTNNVAEYMAVLSSLQWILKNISERNVNINVFVDSQLVANQLSGLYKIKKVHLKIISNEIKNLEQKIGAKIKYLHTRREFNKEADKLVNMALDGRM